MYVMMETEKLVRQARLAVLGLRSSINWPTFNVPNNHLLITDMFLGNVHVNKNRYLKEYEV